MDMVWKFSICGACKHLGSAIDEEPCFSCERGDRKSTRSMPRQGLHDPTMEHLDWLSRYWSYYIDGQKVSELFNDQMNSVEYVGAEGAIGRLRRIAYARQQSAGTDTGTRGFLEECEDNEGSEDEG